MRVMETMRTDNDRCIVGGPMPAHMYTLDIYSPVSRMCLHISHNVFTIKAEDVHML